MNRFSYSKLVEEYNSILDFYYGNHNLIDKLYLLKDKSILGIKLFKEFVKEISLERTSAMNNLWLRSGWTEQEFNEELNRHINPKVFGKPLCES